MKRTLYYGCPAVALVLMTIAIATAQSPKEEAEAEAAAEAAVAEAEVAAAAQIEAAKAQAREAIDQARAAKKAVEERHVRKAKVAVEAVAPIRKEVRVFERHPAWATAGVSWERSAPDEETMKLVDLDRKLSGKVAEIVAKFKDISEDEDREEAEKALADAVAEQFTVRQQMREKQLQQLEEQIERLRGLQDQRSEQKDRIIDDRVQQLIREATGLGWGETSDNFNFNYEFKVDTDVLPFGGPPRIEAPARIMLRPGADAAPVVMRSDVVLVFLEFLGVFSFGW
jgi:hypothetical protein